MRIAMFTFSFAPYWGGAERQAVRLGQALIRRGHQVLHVTSGPGDTLAREELDGLPVLRIPGYGRGPGWRRKLWRRFMPGLRRWLNEEGAAFHVWHVHGAFDPCSLVAAWRGPVVGVPVVLKHASPREYPTLWKITRVPSWIARRVHARCQVHVTNSPELVADIEAFPAFRPVRFLPNGVDLPAPMKEGTLRSELSIPPDAPVISNVANFHPWKNQATLIEAFARAECCPRAHLVLAGDGACLTACQQLARELNVDRRVHFLGRTDRVPEVLRMSQVFAFPSQSEGMANGVTEAMAHGLPVVVLDVPGLTRLVRPGLDGLAEHLCPARWAVALDRLIRNPEEGRRLGESGRQHVEREFHIDQVAARYEALYDGLTAKA